LLSAGFEPGYVVTHTGSHCWHCQRIVPDSECPHNNDADTLHQTTGTTGSAGASRVFTAFGERITTTTDRFGYVGAWGYQSNPIPESQNPDTAFPFLHVGARYYDPSTGRFLQRDPIGVVGGTNVYTYLFNRPTVGVDPSGNGFWGSVWRIIKIGVGVVTGIVGPVLILAGTAGSSPVWVAGVGLVVFVGGLWILLSEVADVWPTANAVVAPICAPAKARNKAVDDAVDDAGLGDVGGGGGLRGPPSVPNY